MNIDRRGKKPGKTPEIVLTYIGYMYNYAFWNK